MILETVAMIRCTSLKQNQASSENASLFPKTLPNLRLGEPSTAMKTMDSLYLLRALLVFLHVVYVTRHHIHQCHHPFL